MVGPLWTMIHVREAVANGFAVRPPIIDDGLPFHLDPVLVWLHGIALAGASDNLALIIAGSPLDRDVVTYLVLRPTFS